MNDCEIPPHLAEPILSLAKSIRDLHRRAVLEYTPVVNAILRNRCQDTQHIERVLDGLLDFCAHDDALLLYKKLCRYYYDIDPAATVDYVYAYRDLWDSENEKQR